MLRYDNQMKACFGGTGKKVLLSSTLSLLIAAVVTAALILPVSCHRHRSEASSESPAGPETPEIPETPAIPELNSTPYINAADVWISMRYTQEHQGIDFSALKDIPIRAPGQGIFNKHLYFHPGVPRWQVNTEIIIGEYAIDLFFEPGNSVTQEEAQLQYDMLIADGTPVQAGDSLGTLYLAPGQERTTLHVGVRLTPTGLAECIMPYCSQEVRTAILDLFCRDHPGEQICYDHTYEIPETPETPTIPELTSTPYLNADDVWISMRYTPEHQGIDFSAQKDIPVRAPGQGTFNKHLYFHPGVPRWQVNTEIYIGKYSIDLLFEPGDAVTQEEAQLQYDMLIADGTPVQAGDSLGTLYRAPSQMYTMLHFGVHEVVTGQAECLTIYCSSEVLTEILDLFHRDHPGEQICYCHTY